MNLKKYVSYTDRGETYRVWGDVEYPVEYGYSSYGKMVTMKTYRSGTNPSSQETKTFPGYAVASWNSGTWPGGTESPDATTWQYDAASGQMTNKVECAFAYMGRRSRKIVSEYTNSAWSVVSTNHYLYDSWNMIQEVGRTVTGEPSTNLYAWGLDLSGTLQGAGGIGGLLSWTRSSDTNTFLYCFDANGNVGQVLDASDGSIAAAYEYSAYGETITETGSECTNNIFMFSTKPYDLEIGKYYYIYRHYDAALGRWLSRDPIGDDRLQMFWAQYRDELIGLNIFSFNDPVGVVDPDGRKATGGGVPPPAGDESVQCPEVQVECKQVFVSAKYLGLESKTKWDKHTQHWKDTHSRHRWKVTQRIDITRKDPGVGFVRYRFWSCNICTYMRAADGSVNKSALINTRGKVFEHEFTSMDTATHGFVIYDFMTQSTTAVDQIVSCGQLGYHVNPETGNLEDAVGRVLATMSTDDDK